MQKNCYASLLASLMLILLSIPSTAKAQEMEDYDFTVEEFSILKIQDNVNVVYHCSQDSVAHVSSV
ncbi:MAG: hypothetical protein K2N19_05780, partial [Muribaculaceae bacterium]|nr:hypothetical protein [Muribaculaceae bacterium]